MYNFIYDRFYCFLNFLTYNNPPYMKVELPFGY